MLYFIVIVSIMKRLIMFNFIYFLKTRSRHKQAHCKYQGYIQCDICNKTLLTAKEVVKTHKLLNLASSLDAIDLIASSDGARFLN